MGYEQWAQIQALVRQYPVQALAIGVLAAGAALVLVIMTARRRRLRDVIAALDESTASVFAVAEQRPGRLAGILDPAPDPFADLHVEFTTRVRDQPAGARRLLFLLPPQQLVLRGVLPRRPANELIWMRGRTPERSIRRASVRSQDGNESTLWQVQRLDVLAGEYAVRGENPSVLSKDFQVLQMRFGAFTQAVTVQQAAPQVIVALNARGLNAGDVAAVVAMMRALGRSALRT